MTDDVGKLNRLKPMSPSLIDVGEAIVDINERAGDAPIDSSISRRVHVPSHLIEKAVEFWKPLYVKVKTEGRLLNGIEAYELGDEKLTNKPNKAPYIAMCNLMTLEALKLMGDTWPTVEAAQELMFGTDREKLVASFWKETFAPTCFQCEWAWAAVMAIQAGSPMATKEILQDYQEQLP